MSSLTNANNDTSSKDVATAARDFLKAASILVETVQELIKVPTSSSNMEQGFMDLQEAYDTNINNINQRLLALESNHTESGTGNKRIKQMTKNEIIWWALNNVKTNCFKFSKSYYICEFDSDECVTETLRCFLRGLGRPIPNDYYIRVREKRKGELPPSDQEKQAFRDALCRHLQDLLGHKPRIVLEEGDDRYCVYYS